MGLALRMGPVPTKCNMSNHGTMSLRVGPVPNKCNMSNHGIAPIISNMCRFLNSFKQNPYIIHVLSWRGRGGGGGLFKNEICHPYQIIQFRLSQFNYKTCFSGQIMNIHVHRCTNAVFSVCQPSINSTTNPLNIVL